jgi:hypothetical protein
MNAPKGERDIFLNDFRRGGGAHPPVPFGLPPPPAAAAAGAPLPQLLRSFSFFELNPGNFLELRVYVTEKWHIERIIIESIIKVKA